jgi:hypothetical protein
LLLLLLLLAAAAAAAFPAPQAHYTEVLLRDMAKVREPLSLHKVSPLISFREWLPS